MIKKYTPSLYMIRPWHNNIIITFNAFDLQHIMLYVYNIALA